MKRKVIQLAGKTSVVSLPLRWVKKNNISKGQELDVIDKGDKLLICSKNNSDVMKITLDVSEKHSFDKRYLSDLYKRGYDEIKINYKNSKILTEIKKFDALGFEIVDQGKDFCILKSVSSEIEDEFDTLLRRSFRLGIEMANGLSEYFSGSNIDLNELRDLEELNNKFTSFCLRVLNKKGHREEHKINFLYSIVRELESVTDIFKYIIDDNCKPNKKEIDYYNKAKDFFILFYELFYKYDSVKFKKFYNLRKNLIIEGKKLIGTSVLGHHSLNLVVSVYNMSGPYMTMNFEEIY